MEGDMGLYILDLPTSKISTEGVGLFSDYYYSRLSDDVLKDFVAVGQKDRFVLLEGSLEQGYDEDRKNWIDTVVIEKSEFATRPASRADHALASSSQDQMIYVFGGADGGKHYKDFWVWNSKENYWREVEDSNGPEGRSRHAMVYDSKRNVLVLFGGKTKKKALGDTWEWDGAKWTSFGTSKVNPREGHAMVYDVESGVVLLFGGRNGSKFYNDLWSWDGFSWKRLSRKGLINPRAEHAMAYDRKQNVVVVFGGFDGTDILGDTWQYDGDDWTLMKAEEMWIDPSARQGAAAVYDESHSQVMLIGGIDRDGHVKDDAYRWDGVEWDRLYIYPTTRIPARTGHAVAFEPKERCVLVFGGWAKGEVNGETWLWDGLDWFNIMP
jgi:hypothetical protein